MGTVALNDILDADFRANPDYQLVQFDRLSAEQQDALRGLTKDADFYGVLVPREGSTRNAKSVCRDTALLLFTLDRPGRLPAYVRETLGDRANQAIAEMVLDGVLEIGCNGRFVCGPEAYALIYGERQAPGTQAQGVLQQLAQSALRYAQALDIDDSARLSARLYFYNRVPLSPAWKRRFPAPTAVMSHLGIENGGASRHLLEGRWVALKLSPPFDGWSQWESRDDRVAEGEARQGYKLYVSPKPDSVRDAFQSVVKVLADAPAHHFKVAREVAGLLRSDKIVVYFWTFDALQETAQQLAARLTGCPAQGVPFTAGIGDDGLLSWGIDPPPEKAELAWQERESWRLWITNRLATALLAAKGAYRDGVGPEPWWFALERLRLEKVDTDSWAPLATFGRPAAEG